MADVTGFTHALENVYLGGIIKECVIEFDGNVAYISAMDSSSSLFVQASAEIEHEDDTIGIDDLVLFMKYMNMIKETDVTFTHTENRLVIKPKGRGTVKYMLGQVDLIPSFDPDWEQDEIAKETKKYSDSMELQQDKVKEMIDDIGIFTPNSVVFEIDNKGKLVVHGGPDTSHKFNCPLGKIKGAESYSVKVFSEHLVAVLSAVDFSAKPELFLKEEEALIISTKEASWVLQPVTLNV